MKVLVRFIGMAALGISLVACIPHDPPLVGDVVVVEKQFSPKHQTSYTTCSKYGCQTHYNSYPDTWTVRLYGKDRYGTRRDSMLIVTRERYDELSVGEHFNIAPGVSNNGPK